MVPDTESDIETPARGDSTATPAPGSFTAQKKAEKARAGEPWIAVLLTWLVPGAGHAYLGRMKLGLIAFVVVEGLYVLGVMLSDGMFLEYLPKEMRTRFAPALAPEAGNLGALLLHVRSYGFGLPFPRVWPSTMDLGTALTATSGIFNALLMSRAHFDARHPQRAPGKPIGPAIAAWLSWVIPGLGQIMQGRQKRGILIAVLLLSLFAVACLVAGGANLDRERHFYYWAGQALLGLPAMITEFAFGHPIMTDMPARVDGGIVMGSVAGLLNVLVMLDAYGYSEAKHLGTEPPTSPKSHKHTKKSGSESPLDNGSMQGGAGQ